MQNNLTKRYSIALDGDELGLVTNLIQMVYTHKAGQEATAAQLSSAVMLILTAMGPALVINLIDRLTILALHAKEDGEIGVIIHDSPIEL